jgi:hypothetical protein
LRWINVLHTPCTDLISRKAPYLRRCDIALATLDLGEQTERPMNRLGKLLVVSAVALAATACTTLNDDDRAAVARASATASQAQTEAARATTAANQAAADARSAAQAAQAAADAAKRAADQAAASSERTERMFQRSQRKVK